MSAIRGSLAVDKPRSWWAPQHVRVKGRRPVRRDSRTGSSRSTDAPPCSPTEAS
jgi:hypothetical protein